MKNILSLRYGKKKLLLILLFFSAFLDLASQEKTQRQVEDCTKVSIPNTELRTLHSAILGQEMELYIKLPLDYNTNPQKIYPAWYMTDGNRSFPMLANMASIFEIPQPTDPEILIIGIGYKIRDMADWTAWRTRDLTPTNVPGDDAYWNKLLTTVTGRQFEVRSGGAATFLEFIVKEVIPFVESNYRASKTGRSIGGYSYGGLFSLYVLFKQPAIFNLYYAGSPSISFDNGVMFNFEKEYASSHKDLNARLFMSAGGLEDSLTLSDMKKMASLLQSRDYPGLTVVTQILPDETHRSCMPSSFIRALWILYNKK
jgi:uncharacterized protein